MALANSYYSSPEEQGYRQIKRLGEGTFGTIYLVEKLETREQFAMKKYAKKYLKINNEKYRVSREHIALEKLKGCHFICNLFEHFQDDHYMYIIIEYVTHNDFFEALGDFLTGFPIEVTRHYSAELVRAMQCMQERGIVHRDIKPENILLGADRHIRLCDFGAAKDLHNLSPKKQYPIGVKGTYCGTSGYMAPEVLEEKQTVYASDLWSLGCTIHHFHTGASPFDIPCGTSKGDELEMIRSMARHYHMADDKGCPEVRDLVKRLLVLNPRDRLGAISFSDLKIHGFFRGHFDWDTLHETEPPYLPVQGPKTEGPEEEGQRGEMLQERKKCQKV